MPTCAGGTPAQFHVQEAGPKGPAFKRCWETCRRVRQGPPPVGINIFLPVGFYQYVQPKVTLTFLPGSLMI